MTWFFSVQDLVLVTHFDQHDSEDAKASNAEFKCSEEMEELDQSVSVHDSVANDYKNVHCDSTTVNTNALSIHETLKPDTAFKCPEMLMEGMAHIGMEGVVAIGHEIACEKMYIGDRLLIADNIKIPFNANIVQHDYSDVNASIVSTEKLFASYNTEEQIQKDYQPEEQYDITLPSQDLAHVAHVEKQDNGAANPPSDTKYRCTEEMKELHQSASRHDIIPKDDENIHCDSTIVCQKTPSSLESIEPNKVFQSPEIVVEDRGHTDMVQEYAIGQESACEKKHSSQRLLMAYDVKMTFNENIMQHEIPNANNSRISTEKPLANYVTEEQHIKSDQPEEQYDATPLIQGSLVVMHVESQDFSVAKAVSAFKFKCIEEMENLDQSASVHDIISQDDKNHHCDSATVTKKTLSSHERDESNTILKCPETVVEKIDHIYMMQEYTTGQESAWEKTHSTDGLLITDNLKMPCNSNIVQLDLPYANNSIVSIEKVLASYVTEEQYIKSDQPEEQYDISHIMQDSVLVTQVENWDISLAKIFRVITFKCTEGMKELGLSASVHDIPHNGENIHCDSTAVKKKTLSSYENVELNTAFRCSENIVGEVDHMDIEGTFAIGQGAAYEKTHRCDRLFLVDNMKTSFDVNIVKHELSYTDDLTVLTEKSLLNFVTEGQHCKTEQPKKQYDIALSKQDSVVVTNVHKQDSEVAKAVPGVEFKCTEELKELDQPAITYEIATVNKQVLLGPDSVKSGIFSYSSQTVMEQIRNHTDVKEVYTTETESAYFRAQTSDKLLAEDNIKVLFRANIFQSDYADECDDSRYLSTLSADVADCTTADVTLYFIECTEKRLDRPSLAMTGGDDTATYATEMCNHKYCGAVFDLEQNDYLKCDWAIAKKCKATTLEYELVYSALSYNRQTLETISDTSDNVYQKVK